MVSYNNQMIYLDWAATAIPKNEIIEDSLKTTLEIYGNPSSAHATGIMAKDLLNKCRIECSKSLNCNKDQVYFTSGASESNNAVLLSFLKKHQVGEIITTSIEHPSVMEPLLTLKKFGWKLKTINPESDGIISSDKIIKSITEHTKIISIIYVHNETGVIQPLTKIVQDIRKKELLIGKKIHIHIDGVQAICKTEVNLDSLGIDSFSISGHKFGAPKGVGILYLNKKRNMLYRGGGQESGIKPGTENVFGILSLTNCLKDSLQQLSIMNINLNTIMDKLISGIREIGIDTIPKSRELNDKNFVPNILSLTCPPLPGEVIARVLSSKGFMVSTGSACSSNKKSTTKGILSMGINEKEGFSSFRVSIGYSTSLEDIVEFLKVLKVTISELNPL